MPLRHATWRQVSVKIIRHQRRDIDNERRHEEQRRRGGVPFVLVEGEQGKEPRCEDQSRSGNQVGYVPQHSGADCTGCGETGNCRAFRNGDGLKCRIEWMMQQSSRRPPNYPPPAASHPSAGVTAVGAPVRGGAPIAGSSHPRIADAQKRPPTQVSADAAMSRSSVVVRPLGLKIVSLLSMLHASAMLMIGVVIAVMAMGGDCAYRDGEHRASRTRRPVELDAVRAGDEFRTRVCTAL